MYKLSCIEVICVLKRQDGEMQGNWRWSQVWLFRNLALRCLNYPRARQQPNDKNEECEDGSAQEVARTELPAVVLRYVGNVGYLEAGDVSDVAVADFR